MKKNDQMFDRVCLDLKKNEYALRARHEFLHDVTKK